MKDYHSTHAVDFERFPVIGYTDVEVLPFLKGHKWDEIALAFVHSVRPGSIRVTKDWQTTDANLWRVTVFVDENDIIKAISQEVEVGIPDGIENIEDGYTLSQAVNCSNLIHWPCDDKPITDEGPARSGGITALAKRIIAFDAHIKRCWNEFGFRQYFGIIDDERRSFYKETLWFRNSQGHTVPSEYKEKFDNFCAPWNDNLDGNLYYVVDDFGVLVPIVHGLPYMYHELNHPPR